jgi:hypothetical protein
VSSPVTETKTPHASATAVTIFVGSQSTGEPLELLEDELLEDELLVDASGPASRGGTHPSVKEQSSPSVSQEHAGMTNEAAQTSEPSATPMIFFTTILPHAARAP